MTHELGQPIAFGRTAEIFSWHPGEVLKLFYQWVELENIEKEARISRAIHASGLPTPAVGEIVRVNQRYGLEYERIDGESMWGLFQHKPWNWSRYAYRCAELQAAVHATTLQTSLPSQRKTLEADILDAMALPERLRSKALSALRSMPGGTRLCHGDFWPGNILVTSQGEIIIDWVHASFGNPLADLARTTNLAYGLFQTRQIERPFLSYGSTKMGQLKNSLLQVFLCNFYPTYLKFYFELFPGDRNEYHRWLPIVAAARLVDDIPELEEMLIAQVEQNL